MNGNTKRIKSGVLHDFNILPNDVPSEFALNDQLNIFFLTFRFGALCINNNNHPQGKSCSDYKTRFCCKKDAPSTWGK